MDPISAIIIGLIWAAWRASGEAGRSVRNDYRNRRGRWNSRAESWMGGRGQGRGRGGRRIAGYDRQGRPYTDRDRGRRGGSGRPRGERGWWRDDRAWRGPEGRARIARGVRPSAIRAGIITGALAYTAVFGAGVAARGFARGLRGGYRMGKQHYLGKRNHAQDPTFTVTPGSAGEHLDPDAEVVDAVIVEDANTSYDGPTSTDPFGRRRERPKPGYVTVVEPEPGEAFDGRWLVTTTKQAYNKEIYAFIVADAGLDEVKARRVPDGTYRTIQPLPANDTRQSAAGWKISRYSVGAWTEIDEPSEYITVTDPVEFDRLLDELMQRDQIFDVRGMHADEVARERARSQPDPEPEAQAADPLELTETVALAADVKNGPWLLIVHGPGVNRFSGGDSEGFAVYDAAELDRRLAVIAGIPGLRAEVQPLPDPDTEDSRPQTAAGSTTDPLTKEQTVTDTANPGPVPVVASYVPVGGAPVFASQLLEGANYDAHRYNLGFLLLQAQREYASGELALAAATATRQRAQHDVAAAEQMAANLTIQDFGAQHVAYMTDLGETLAAQVFAARDAENAAREALATNEQIIEVCLAAEAAFRRDHGQLAEAHASAPHAAKTRDAYQD